MSLLDDRPITIQLRQGTDANLVKSTTYAIEGEPLFTTDTLQVFVADGANNKNPVGGSSDQSVAGLGTSQPASPQATASTMCSSRKPQAMWLLAASR